MIIGLHENLTRPVSIVLNTLPDYGKTVRWRTVPMIQMGSLPEINDDDNDDVHGNF